MPPQSRLATEQDSVSKKKEKKERKENMRVNLHDFGLGNGFLEMTLKAKATKYRSLGLFKIQNTGDQKTLPRK